MRRKNVVAGALFGLIGAAVVILSGQYRMGTASAMGPGYFPFWLGALLLLTGVAVVLQAVRTPSEDSGDLVRFKVRSIFIISLAVSLFGVALTYLGLPVAVMAMTFVAVCAADRFRLSFALVLTAVLLLLAFLIFVWGLDLQLPLWPRFLR